MCNLKSSWKGEKKNELSSVSSSTSYVRTYVSRNVLRRHIMYTLVSGLFMKVQATLPNDNFLESLTKKPSSVKVSTISINQEKMVKTILLWLFKDIFRQFHYSFHWSRKRRLICCLILRQLFPFSLVCWTLLFARLRALRGRHNNVVNKACAHALLMPDTSWDLWGALSKALSKIVWFCNWPWFCCCRTSHIICLATAI